MMDVYILKFVSGEDNFSVLVPTNSALGGSTCMLFVSFSHLAFMNDTTFSDTVEIILTNLVSYILARECQKRCIDISECEVTDYDGNVLSLNSVLSTVQTPEIFIKYGRSELVPLELMCFPRKRKREKANRKSHPASKKAENISARGDQDDQPQEGATSRRNHPEFYFSE